MARKFVVWTYSNRINKEVTSYAINDAMTPAEEDADNRLHRPPIATFPVNATRPAPEQLALAKKLAAHLNDIAEKAEMASKLLDL